MDELLPGTGVTLALIAAFLVSKALREYYKNWEVRRYTQGDGPAGGRGHWPYRG